MRAYRLVHDYKHLVDVDYDMFIEPTPDFRSININMMGPRPMTMPEHLLFRGNFLVIPNETDFPLANVSFPVMSKRMIDVLWGVRPFNHSLLSTSIIDDTYLDDYLDAQGQLKKDVSINRSYFGVKFLEFTEVFDYASSDFVPSPSNPAKPVYVNRMVLREPEGGFPSVFKIKEDSLQVLVSQEGKEALDLSGFKGCVFEEVEVKHNTSSDDNKS